jgi:hypothetical protein
MKLREQPSHPSQIVDEPGSIQRYVLAVLSHRSGYQIPAFLSWFVRGARDARV